MRKKNFNLILPILIFIAGCTQIPHVDPIPQQIVTVTISRPENFDCYILHQLSTPQPSQRRIKIKLTVETTIVNGAPGTDRIDSRNIEIDPNNSSLFPITVSLNGASQQQYTTVCTFVGIECSECARGFGGSSISSDLQCSNPDPIIIPGPLLTYRGALPRWEGSRTVNAGQNVAITQVKRIMNQSNSCGCRVSE